MRLKSKDQNIWFTSDTHYWHNNLTSGVSNWTDKEKCRDFNTVEEMSSHMVAQINKYVKEDDILFFLGDWSFGGIANVWNFRKQLNVKTIHLILGNHDHHIEFQKHELPNVRRVEPYSEEFEDGKGIGLTLKSSSTTEAHFALNVNGKKSSHKLNKENYKS